MCMMGALRVSFEIVPLKLRINARTPLSYLRNSDSQQRSKMPPARNNPSARNMRQAENRSRELVRSMIPDVLRRERRARRSFTDMIRMIIRSAIVLRLASRWPGIRSTVNDIVNQELPAFMGELSDGGMANGLTPGVSNGHSEPVGNGEQNMDDEGLNQIIPVDELNFNMPEVVDDSNDPYAPGGPTPAGDIAPGASAPVESLVNAPEVSTSAESEIDPEGCCVCRSAPEQVYLDCGHRFCGMCPAKWQAASVPMSVHSDPGCPVCRQPYTRVHPLPGVSYHAIVPLEAPQVQNSGNVGNAGPVRAPVEIWEDHPYPGQFFVLGHPNVETYFGSLAERNRNWRPLGDGFQECRFCRARVEVGNRSIRHEERCWRSFRDYSYY